jgi:dihydrofolate reductase
MKLVVAVDKNWGIGNKGGLLAHVRADLRYFQSLTKGNVVILGSKTLATFPNGMPLKNRENIILSRRIDFSPEGATVVHSLAELLETLKNYDTETVFVIGGSTVYDLLLEYCDIAYVTKFDKEFESDAFFCNLDESPEWELESVGEKQISNPETDTVSDMEFAFCVYKRTARKKAL